MHRAALALTVAIAFAACASAQTPGTRRFRTLTETVVQPETAQTRELRVQWTASSAVSGDAAQTANSFTLLQQRLTAGALRRERNPEVSVNHLVIVTQDSTGRDVDWRVVPNPRIVRAETPGPDGKLTGQVVDPGPVEMLLAVPDIPGAALLRIYKPIWNGKEYDLQPLGQVALGSGR